MVQHVMAIEDKEERNNAAKAIISIMGNLNPHLRDISDFNHKLWDHLVIMSEFNIDIDAPFDLPEADTFYEKPKKVDYNINRIRYRHYGKIIEKMIEKAQDITDPDEKKRLATVIANHMKKSYLTWNREVVTDEVVIADLAELSKGYLTLDPGTTLVESREILARKNKKKGNKRK